MTIEEVRKLRERLSLRFNNHLIEMEEGYDDSITGFNECWRLVIKFFDRIEAEVSDIASDNTPNQE